jgi:hypothetical protein
MTAAADSHPTRNAPPTRRTQPDEATLAFFRPLMEGIARGRRFVLSDLTPSAIRARGGEAGRESERAYADLLAVQTAREADEPSRNHANP